MGIEPSRLRRLAGALAGTVRDEPAALAAVATDGSTLPGAPDAVVRPEGFDDLVRLVAWAREERTPLVARGGGTALDGEAVPTGGGVVIDFSGWDRILEINAVDGVVRVEPGVINRRLDTALREHGLTYPPNPGSGSVSTIGGNVATNASGPRSFRYGPTRHWVRALEVVDGRGRRWVAGGRAAKASTGPDLTSLLVGSEGTLALFGAITLRVARRPTRRTGAVVPIPDGPPLGEYVRELADALGGSGSALEFVDAVTATAQAAVAGRDWPSARGLLLVEIEGEESEEGAALERVAALARRHGLESNVAIYPEADRLWEIRGQAGPALDRAIGGGVREDVVVPLSQLDALRSEVDRIAARHGVAVHVFGHIGQGNLHPVFATDPLGPGAPGLRDELAKAALALGGAISGEHGIGVTKRALLTGQLGPTGVELLRTLKATLDPDGILNPGKLYPEPPPAAPPSGSPSAGPAPRTRAA